MADWQETRLGVVARHFRGYSYSSAELTGGGDDFISLKVFEKGGGFRVDGVKSIDTLVPQRFRVPAGAVLVANTDLTRDGDVVGVAAVVPQQFDGAVFSMDATRCVPDSDLLDDRFLALALGTPEVRAFMRGSSAGSTVLHLDTRRLDQVPLLLPPLEEQRRIAETLDTIDETIQATERVIAKRKRIRAGLAAGLLSGRPEGVPTEDWKTNETLPPPASTSTSRNSDMSDAVTERRALGLDVEVLQGFAFSSGGFSEEKGLPLIRIRDLTTGTTETNYCGPYPDEYVINRGDVLIGMDGDFRVVRWSGEKALLNQRVCRVRPSGPSLDDRFLFHALQPEIDRVHRLTPQTTVRHLNTRGIRACTVLDVPLEEQRRIAEILDTIDKTIRVEEAQGDKLRRLRSGLAADLLSGRVRTVAA